MSRRRRVRTIVEKSDQQQKSEKPSDHSHCLSSIVFSKQNSINRMKVYATILWCHGSQQRVWKFKIYPKILRYLLLRKFLFRTRMRLKKSYGMMIMIMIIDYDQVPLTREFKIIICENKARNIFSIFLVLVFNGESALDEIRQKNWNLKKQV